MTPMVASWLSRQATQIDVQAPVSGLADCWQHLGSYPMQVKSLTISAFKISKINLKLKMY